MPTVAPIARVQRKRSLVSTSTSSGSRPPTVPGTSSNDPMITRFDNTGAHEAAKKRRRACSSAFARALTP
jgi:hypothetical protein